nr:E3 ubiquitin-protein ligase PRT1-like isoform X1 [Tanacetum cinerariifolium]
MNDHSPAAAEADHGDEKEVEEYSDEFTCCVCLDLLYKPVVLACGHISCFWCVYEAMDTWQESRCPVCRHSFAYALFLFSIPEHLPYAHVHWPEVPWKQSLYFRVYLGGRGRICLHFTSPIPCFGGIGYVVVVVKKILVLTNE